MNLKLRICKDYTAFDHTLLFIDSHAEWTSLGLSKTIVRHAQNFLEQNPSSIFQQQFEGKNLLLLKTGETKEPYQGYEQARRLGYQANRILNNLNIGEAALFSAAKDPLLTEALIEGIALSNYEFLKYKTQLKKKKSFTSLQVDTRCCDQKRLNAIQHITEANFFTRNLINEPANYLTAAQLSKEIASAGKKYGFSVQVFNKKKIESLGMGGLLAVNRGSIDPPTFTLLEYKPSKPKNKKPIVLVGKGVVYDTGGLSLKPTTHSMDLMKCDMGGGAAVAGIFIAASLLQLPVHLVGLVPATDNRPGGNAYAPGDVITMMSGLKVEMLNADAEGRMILADALHYAKRYTPELVCDFATLTGSAKAAIGSVGTPFMGTADTPLKEKMIASGKRVYERVTEFPFWEEYGDMLKSDIADIKNIGGPEAGCITAGKFLEHFTDYPWLHFDIAGTAYLAAEDSYRGKYATGVAVRLITDFLRNY